MKKNTYRIPIGFVAALVFLYRADPSAVSFALGLLVMIFGEALRFISAGTLVKFEGVTREGIYSYVRNPLYIGSFFIGLGACVLGRDMYFTVFYLIAYPTVYYRIIKREENWLIGRYGDDYRAYLQETPRLLPRRFPRADLFYYSAPFLAVKNRELKTVAGILAVTIILGLKMLLF